MAKVLVVEDDRQLSALIVDFLQGDGHLPECVYKGSDGAERLAVYKYDLVILDWELPGLSGVDVCRQYRDCGGQTPIIMLTGKNTVDEKETGLDAGADDYLTKPFHLKELAARMRALLRRPPVATANLLKAGHLTLDPASRRVCSGDKELNL